VNRQRGTGPRTTADGDPTATTVADSDAASRDDLAADIEAAARAVDAADAVIVTAGAGMGVDSGLPDFRGDDGFWRAYPPYRDLGLSFVDMASPSAFRTDPAFAWGFYGHRRALYRETSPHAGFEVLRDWIARAPAGGFVATSNVDGHFHASGFDPARIWEVHGTLRHDQCLARCGQPLFPAGGDIAVDTSTMRAEPPLPSCPSCDALARPNVLMFGDGGWDPSASDAQQRRFQSFLDDVAGARLVIVECGAGTAVPTIRRVGEQLTSRYGATLVRINPREPHGAAISLPVGAADALAAIDRARHG
jgi:NAD-dependent SIR2 family protein deacetylase